MKSPADLAAIRKAKSHVVAQRHDNSHAIKVIVGMGTAGIKAGARPVMSAFVEEIFDKGLFEQVVVYPADPVEGEAPTVVIDIPGTGKTTYSKVSTDKVKRIVEEHIIGKKAVAEFMK